MSHLNFFNLRKGISENTGTSAFFKNQKIYLQTPPPQDPNHKKVYKYEPYYSP